jgi:hypothetical protein
MPQPCESQHVGYDKIRAISVGRDKMMSALPKIVHQGLPAFKVHYAQAAESCYLASSSVVNISFGHGRFVLPFLQFRDLATTRRAWSPLMWFAAAAVQGMTTGNIDPYHFILPANGAGLGQRMPTVSIRRQFVYKLIEVNCIVLGTIASIVCRHLLGMAVPVLSPWTSVVWLPFKECCCCFACCRACFK